MSFWTASMLLIAGIAIHAAGSHGFLGLSTAPRDRARLALAVTAAAVAVGAISVAALTVATSPEQHVLVAKWVFFPASVVWTVGMIWFVAFSTEVRPKRLLVTLSLALAAVLLVNARIPTGLLHDRFGDMRQIEILGSATTIVSDAPPHPLMSLYEVLMLTAFVYVLYALHRVHRDDRRGEAGHLFLVIPLFVLTMVAHLLTDRAMLAGHYLTELGFFAVVLALSFSVQRNAVRAELNLQTYRTRLEDMVEDRVQALNMANAHLHREISDHRSTEDSLRSRMAELDALQHISHQLTAAKDIRKGLVAASGHIRRLFKAQHVQIDMLAADSSGENRLQWDDIISSSETAGGPTVASAPTFHSLVEQRKSILVEEFDFHSPDSRLEDLSGDRLEEHAVGCFLVLPMLGKEELVGVMGIGRGMDGPIFGDAERRLAQTVADRLAVAIENDRLHALQKQRAATAERNRLARDLHDAVTQSIYSASLIAEALPAVFTRSQPEGFQNLERLRALVRAALAEMRTLLCELRPAALEAAELKTLLERLGEVLAGQADIPVAIEVDEEMELPEEIKVAFYRVVQEALGNVVKHAGATNASVRVAKQGSTVVLTVDDDGCGFEPSAAGSDHMGLRIMQERMDAVGARLEITSAPSRGTSLVVRWTRPDRVHAIGRQ